MAGSGLWMARSGLEGQGRSRKDGGCFSKGRADSKTRGNRGGVLGWRGAFFKGRADSKSRADSKDGGG